MCQIVVVVRDSVYLYAAVDFDVEILEEVVGASYCHIERNLINFGVNPVVTAISTAANLKNCYFISNCYVLLVNLVVSADHLRHLDCVCGLVGVLFDLGVNFDDIGVLEFPHGGQHGIRGYVLVPDGVAVSKGGVV